MVTRNRLADDQRYAPNGIRTRATALKGPRPGPLVDGGQDGPQATGRRGGDVTSKPTLLTSPANRLCRKRVDLAVLVDRDHIPLFRTPAYKQVQDEVQPMPAHDHGLSAAPRLDPEALRDPPRDVRIERRRTHIACCRSHLASASVSAARVRPLTAQRPKTTSRSSRPEENRVASVKPARAMTRSRPESCRFSRRSACAPR